MGIKEDASTGKQRGSAPMLLVTGHFPVTSSFCQMVLSLSAPSTPVQVGDDATTLDAAPSGEILIQGIEQ